MVYKNNRLFIRYPILGLLRFYLFFVCFNLSSSLFVCCRRLCLFICRRLLAVVAFYLVGYKRNVMGVLRVMIIVRSYFCCNKLLGVVAEAVYVLWYVDLSLVGFLTGVLFQ